MIMKPEKTEFEIIPAGLTPAVCIGYAELGNQEGFEGKLQQKILLCFKTDAGQISKEYTASFNSKANLRKDIEGWRGKKFGDEIYQTGFDLNNLINKKCTLNITHKTSKAGNDYAIIAGINPEMNGLEYPIMDDKEKVVFAFEHPTKQAEYSALPEWIQNKIQTAPEFNMAFNGGDPFADDPGVDDIDF